MTIQEIVAELDGLKDYTNAHGKGLIDRLKGELRLLEAPVVEAPKDRRSDERDPGEHEQNLAEHIVRNAPKKKAK
jgi:hypothetical protein